MSTVLYYFYFPSPNFSPSPPPLPLKFMTSSFLLLLYVFSLLCFPWGQSVLICYSPSIKGKKDWVILFHLNGLLHKCPFVKEKHQDSSTAEPNVWRGTTKDPGETVATAGCVAPQITLRVKLWLLSWKPGNTFYFFVFFVFSDFSLKQIHQGHY